jgi:very-short-patch-repair endonuclease
VLVTKRITWKTLTYQDRERIREEYAIEMPKLLAGVRRDPYAIWPHDWTLYMSPIEENIWSDIRAYGLPFYPQFPIGKYFADFADPKGKIVIEADGRDYHTDKAKDLARQGEIEALGYKVFRFDGSLTYADTNTIYDDWESRDVTDEEKETDMAVFLNSGYSEAFLMKLRDEYYHA